MPHYHSSSTSNSQPEPNIDAKSPSTGLEAAQVTPDSPPQAQIEAYWLERKRYLKELKKVPELRRRYAKALAIYLLRRLLWSFTFFPIFIAFWVPFVLSRFNPVAMASNLLPSLESFVQSDPQAQAATVETLVIAWFSIGFLFAVFDFVLTPFKSPYEQEAEVHMRAWEALAKRHNS